MKNIFISIATLFIFSILIISCDENNTKPEFLNFKDVKLTVNFGGSGKKSISESKDIPMINETPWEYSISLKSATLIGSGETEDYVIFNEENLASSTEFEFTENDSKISILQGEDIPEGTYDSIKLEIYYLQMNIAISTGERGMERRNFRIYLSDDAETEGNLHQPGDMTQINDGIEIGWLLGEGQEPNMDPVTPRTDAYTHNGDGTTWYDFTGKSGENYGPFGDTDFMDAPHPVYYKIINFSFESTLGQTMIVEFDVINCWQFEDKDSDGAFGFGDLDPVNPTKWHMELPDVTVSFE